MFQLRMTGLDSLQRAMREQPARVRAGLQDLVAATSFAIAQRARANVPVDTGAYKAAITTTNVSGLSGGVVIGSGVIRGRRPEVYWRFVEFGTVHVPARPALRDAAQGEIQDVEARVQHLADAIERDLSSGGAL